MLILQLQMNIKQSKTDLFRLGVKVWISRTGGNLCPVAAILSYMAVRGPGEDPLFCFQNGNPLTRQRLVTRMREVLQKVDIDCSKYLGAQLQDWSCHNSSSKGDSGFSRKDHEQMGECGISAVHQNTPSSATLNVTGIGRN